ncbi:MAG TPA: Vms1/Ankzf1 family peptidyl-tRNA hydrolase [Gaiellaceae bacterium]|jgi:peptide chain release factor subunit 1
MARTVTWSELRTLAEFEAENGCAVSVYLDLDPSVAPTAADAATRLNSLLDEGAKSDRASRDKLTHVERQALHDDFDRIRSYYTEEFTRNGARGLAVFAAALDNVWRALPLAESVTDAVRVAPELYVAPLVPLTGRGEGAFVVAVSRERGEIFQLRSGRLEPVADLSDEQPGRHDQGGWSQARYQRHIDALAQEHLREVAARLDALVRRSHHSQVVAVATDDSWAEFSPILSSEVNAALAGRATAEAHASNAQLLAAAAPVLERWRDDREASILEQWREEAGRDGRASSGWERTFEAASDARVELLLFQAGVNRSAWRCPACGRLAAHGGKCPLDATTLEERGDGLDLLIHQTLVHGGSVWTVQHAHDLEPVEGIGAVLRF